MAFRLARSIMHSRLERVAPLVWNPCRKFHRTNRLSGYGIVQHRHTPDNNDDTPFEWTEESLERIKFELSKFPKNRKKSACIPLLWIAQEQNDNWLPINA